MAACDLNTILSSILNNKLVAFIIFSPNWLQTLYNFNTLLYYKIIMLKKSFHKINEYLIYYNNKQQASIWSFIHRWNYEHSLVKNLLRVSNNILVSVNKYHIFRWDWFSVLFGIAAGYVVGELEQFYSKQKLGYKPALINIIDQHVLKNQIVGNKLKEVIVANVCYSSDIQYYVHQVLLNQVLDPNKDRIKQLIKMGINMLNDKQTSSYIAQQFVLIIPSLQNPIKQAALTFLNSQKMDSICAYGFVSALSNLYIKSLMAGLAQSSIKWNLSSKQNQQAIYNSLRQKIIF